MKILGELAAQCEKIFHTKFYFYIDDLDRRLNCVCFPIMKKNSTEELLKTPEQVKLNNVREFHVIIGSVLISVMSPRQLTAILFHEIGHVVNDISRILLITAKILKYLGGGATLFLMQHFFSLVWSFPVFIVMTFMESKVAGKAKEYKADKFAVEYGYGDELVGALDRLSQIEDYIRRNSKKPSLLIGVVRVFNRILSKLISSHPSNEKRINIIIRDILKDYADQYPEFKKAIEASMDY